MTRTLTGRFATGYAIGVVAVALALTACSSNSNVGGNLVHGSPGVAGQGSSSGPTFADIVSSGPVASDAEVAASPWAVAIKNSGALRLGSTNAGIYFSLTNPATGNREGFDAGIANLLAHYILGSSYKYGDSNGSIAFTAVSTATRETLLQNSSVDVVIATYTITAARQEKVGFAGPYFTDSAGALTKDGVSYTSLSQFKGKKVITQEGSAYIQVLKDAGFTDVLTFTQDADCTSALLQGRGDVYVNDTSILLGEAAKNPGTSVSNLGKSAAPDDYGIGVNKGTQSDSVPFINGFLKKIEAAGVWQKLWANSLSSVLRYVPPTPPPVTQHP